MMKTKNIQIITHSLKRKCPNCGEGSLFEKYIKAFDHCTKCHESFKNLRADDGPAWLTIIIVGHIIVPLFLYLERNFQLSYFESGVILVVVSSFLVLLILPFSKSVFMTALWHLYHKKP